MTAENPHVDAAKACLAEANAKRHEAWREAIAARCVTWFLNDPELSLGDSMIAQTIIDLGEIPKDLANVHALRALINARPDLAEIALAAAEYAVRREAEKAGR